MTDEKLRQLLSALPDEEQISARAGQARRRALARLEDRAPATRRWPWAPAFALVVALTAVAVWLGQAWRVEPLEWKPPAPVIAAVPLPPPSAPATVEKPSRQPAPLVPQPDRRQMQLVLSDGTRVLWTFDKNFNL